MAKLTCLRGFSGSGKSTQAAKIAKKTGAVVVNRDSLRRMMLNDWWTGEREDEDRVTIAEEAQVTALLRAGVSVVIDATHLEPRFLRKWARLATRLGVEFDTVDVHADLDECKRRAYERWRTPGREFGRYIDPEVIDRQAKRHPPEKWPTITAQPFRPEPVKWIDGLPVAVILDLDGTIAVHSSGRSPYDLSRVHEDSVDEHIRWLVNGLSVPVLAVSGREDSCREATAKWLADHGVIFAELHMRQAGDYRPDYLIKDEIYEREIRGRFNIRFCIDDRASVIEMWRSKGLKVLDVAGNEF